MKIGVLGAGTWGMALSALLSKNGHDVTVWSALQNEIDYLKKTNTHKNLKGITFPESIKYTTDIEEAAADAELVLFVVASSYIRKTARDAARYIKDGTILVSAAKGIESGTLITMTDIIEQEVLSCGDKQRCRVAALSGPTHAEEVAAGLPTSIVSACEDEQTSRIIANVFSSSCMRVYMNTDVLGVELGGALKNIVALACGINRGMGFGDNASAALMTRGAAEITRIGLAMGANLKTFLGLAGIGDLIVTCTSEHSRNNRCGKLIGLGKSYEEALAEIGMVVEGYHALGAAMELSKKHGVEMPITEAVYNIIHNGLTPKEAMVALMGRDIKNELNIQS